jgi:enamine deaminase RidA (YjgF/YER057c/UK114 family)
VISIPRSTVSSGAPWEAVVGYCRAVRIGPHIAVSGTAPVTEDGAVFAVGDPYEQAKRCIEIIAEALGRLDAGLEHVVRTRMFVTDIGQWEAIGRAHGEAFGDIRPATSMVEVAALIHPDMLVEIEADAFVS